MGKLQEGFKANVKREMVSASANLEVISQESFVKRLEGMSSSCQNCQKERNRSQRSRHGRKGKNSRRKQLSKSNTPIVIHLKDALPSLGTNRQSSLDGDSDVSIRSTDEEQYTSSGCSSGSNGSSMSDLHGSTSTRDGSDLDRVLSSLYGDVASIPEFVPQYRSHHFHQAWPHKLYRYVPVARSGVFPQPTVTYKSPYHSFHSTSHMDKEKSRKNLTGLISDFEKNYSKGPKPLKSNLNRNSTEAKSCNVLNNVSLSVQCDSKLKRKNMAKRENVELICNDLSSTTGTSREPDMSDRASDVPNSDSPSVNVTELSGSDESTGHMFTTDELQQLAQYTTGVPLIRYDYSTSQCLECTSAYQYLQYEGSPMYMYSWPSPRCYSCHSYPHSNGKQQPLSTSYLKQSQKSAVSLKTSSSSESDVLSDIVESYTSSTSSTSSTASSSSSSKRPAASAANGLPTMVTYASKVSSRNPTVSRPEIRQVKPVKRATVSWKNARHLAQSSKPINQKASCVDSVFLDLTGLDVSISVTYHTELPVWPYPVHSLYQALYSVPTTVQTSGINFPLCFNNQMFYSFHSEMAPPVDFKRYEMSLPPNRPWITAGSPDKDVPAAVFSVMCYNVLCDKLCTKAMYAYCPTWALNWDYRKKGIMSDILRGNADIITLQEVETEQYYSMFYPELAQQGYDGIFLPKSRVRTMNSDKEKKVVDGCAIFFRKTKFEKVNEYHVEFSQLATKDGVSNTDTDMINRVSTKDNIAIVAVLRTKPGVYSSSPVAAPKGLTQMLMVSTAHIHWDPQSPDVKLVQTMMLVEELQKFVKEASLQFRPNAPPPSLDTDLCNSIPLILCGDFNSLPDSGVYEYISKGRLDTSHKDFQGQNYQVFMKDRNENGNIFHNFKLTSAYKDVIPFTNYTFDFKGIIDYIFYSNHHLRLHGVMGLQDEEWFRANKIVGCPHPFVPSDHFPLFAEFSLPVLPQRPR